jgi:hypothetical protein
MKLEDIVGAVAEEPEVPKRTARKAVHMGDEYDQYFAGTSVVTDLDTIDLTSASGWQMGGPGAWTTATVPPTTENPGPSPRHYRYVTTWDSTDLPNGCNGDHTVRIVDTSGDQTRIAFSDGTETEVNGPDPVRGDVENLYISNVTCTPGNIDYFKWDPEAGGALADPVIEFDIVDADPHGYDWVIHFRQTGGTNSDGTWPAGSYWAASGHASSTGTVTVALGVAGHGISNADLAVNGVKPTIAIQLAGPSESRPRDLGTYGYQVDGKWAQIALEASAASGHIHSMVLGCTTAVSNPAHGSIAGHFHHPGGARSSSGTRDKTLPSQYDNWTHTFYPLALEGWSKADPDNRVRSICEAIALACADMWAEDPDPNHRGLSVLADGRPGVKYFPAEDDGTAIDNGVYLRPGG